MDKPLGERRERILHVIVEQYVRTAEPVGSRAVADESDLGVSSATVRNEMGILEREGYITHPHTSAGRIPTDRGYRYYVDVLAPRHNIAPSEREEIERSLSGTVAALDELLQKASELLAGMTDYTALAALPPMNEAAIKFLDLIPLGGNRVFLVLVGEGARHEERILQLRADIAAEEIRRAAERLNNLVNGLGPTDAAARLQETDVAPGDLQQAVRVALADVARGAGRLYTGGASHVVSWGEPLATRRVLEAIEAGTVRELMAASSDRDGVKVHIGRELPLEELQDLSMILSAYELGKQRAGSLAVLGPTRMQYPRVISLVTTVARSVSRALRRLESS